MRPCTAFHFTRAKRRRACCVGGERSEWVRAYAISDSLPSSLCPPSVSPSLRQLPKNFSIFSLFSSQSQSTLSLLTRNKRDLGNQCSLSAAHNEPPPDPNRLRRGGARRSGRHFLHIHIWRRGQKGKRRIVSFNCEYLEIVKLSL